MLVGKKDKLQNSVYNLLPSVQSRREIGIRVCICLKSGGRHEKRTKGDGCRGAWAEVAEWKQSFVYSPFMILEGRGHHQLDGVMLPSQTFKFKQPR